MSDIILHHFDSSPFAEKARVALGVKGLSWNSVQIPLVLPKPDLVALTGGYRKTPVMQIGADIYCDTQRIAQELDARFAGSSLFPSGTEGLCLALANWSDLMLFRSGASLSMGTNRDLPEDIKRDRFAFFDFLDEGSLGEQLPHLFGQFRASLFRLEGMLSDGRVYLMGDAPSWADAACYAPVWMCRGNIQGADELLQELQYLAGWEQRVAGLGHGQRREMTAEDALNIAQQATAEPTSKYVDDRWSKLKFGHTVSVTPDDYGAVPVAGELILLTDTEIAIRRDDERAGQVVVHFPRSGYRVDKI